MKLSRIFVSDAGIRAGWRLLIWVAIVVGIDVFIEFFGAFAVPRLRVDHAFLDPRWLLLGDTSILVAALSATLIMKRIERRPLSDYYISTRDFFGRQFWLGLLWGFLAVSLLIGLISAFRGYRIAGVAMGGTQLIYWTLWWLIAAFMIGVAEEIAFRAYLLRTLADGMRFWPAAAFLSIGFGALHYFTKPFERWEDFVSTGLLGLFGCLTIRRTGSLAFIIGLHASFDWAAMYFYSGRNAGEYAVGHLLQTAWTGPDWLTGGMLGPEASWFVFVVIALLFLMFSRIYPSPPKNS